MIRLLSWIRPHVHEWHDWYVFDSSAVTTLGARPSFRVVGQQIMTVCAKCEATKRKPLRTWREARLARKRLPYKRWGIWSFSLELPPALRDRDAAQRKAAGFEAVGQQPGPKASHTLSRNPPPKG